MAQQLIQVEQVVQQNKSIFAPGKYMQMTVNRYCSKCNYLSAAEIEGTTRHL